jgi:hypothetical protein
MLFGRGRPTVGLAVVLACLWVAGGTPRPVVAQSISINDGEGSLERCDQLDIRFGNRPALRDEARVQVPAGAGALRANVSHHGGIALAEGAGTEHEVTLCKAVPQGGDVDLSAIGVAVNGSSVEVTGPSRQWVGYLIIRSPKGSRLELSATNGPIRAESFDGDISVRTVNGPIALAAVRGRVSARAENGPIKLEAAGGQISIETQNGPISVRLGGEQWESGELVARAENGPLSLSLPREYRSGVEIESSRHAPWSCRGAAACGERVSGSGGRRTRLGEGATLVRVSTVNGPVKVDVTNDSPPF